MRTSLSTLVEADAWLGWSVASVTLCVCMSILWKKNSLSYQRQTWYTHTHTLWHALVPYVKRSRSRGYEVCRCYLYTCGFCI